MSTAAFDNIIPVQPPTVNKNINPSVNSIVVSNLKRPPHIVANQLKIFTPVGTAIIIVAPEKYILVSTSNPEVNIW